MAGDDDSPSGAGDDFHGVEVGEDGDIRVTLHFFYQAGLYLGAGVVFMMQDAELGMPAFAVQVELSVLLFIEVHPPIG